MLTPTLNMMRVMSHRYNRNVTLTFVRSHGAWRAECAGIIKQSQVGPEDALVQLSFALNAAGTSRKKTEMLPAVGAR